MFSVQTLFLMRNYLEGVNYARDNNENVSVIDGATGLDGADTLHRIATYHPDWIVIDLPYPDLDLSYIKELKQLGSRIIFIDDCRFVSPSADVIINSNVLALEKTRIPSKCRTRYLLGPRYFIFDENERRKPRLRAEGRQNVLLTFGGSDPTGMTAKVLSTIKKVHRPPSVLLRVILGPGFREISVVRSLVQAHSNIEIVAHPSDIIPYFLGSDFVLCAGGRTMYELLYLNRRFLPIATAKHEADEIRAFRDRRLIEHGLLVWDPELFINIIEEYFSREAIN
jgi:spore coat polysaccharide biosynthesis predicted glycosyltransferase SpsG